MIQVFCHSDVYVRINKQKNILSGGKKAMNNVIDKIRDFCMYVTFTITMARDVRRLLKEERMMNGKMLYRL